MIFDPTPLKDAWVVSLDPILDKRGSFARMFCESEFQAHGIDFNVVQVNRAISRKMGTLHGLHFLPPPHAEPKLVQCVHGAIYDVIVDMRPDSPTYRISYEIELTQENGRMLFIPPYCAHGYLTLVDDVEICYLMGEYYVPGLEEGIRYNDPVFNIDWPRSVEVISQRDANFPLL